MADAVTVTLGKLGEKARSYVAEGRYASMSEVLRAGIRALEREEAELDALLKAKVAEALANPGPYVPLDEAMARVRAAPMPERK